MSCTVVDGQRTLWYRVPDCGKPVLFFKTQSSRVSDATAEIDDITGGASRATKNKYANKRIWRVIVTRNCSLNITNYQVDENMKVHLDNEPGKYGKIKIRDVNLKKLNPMRVRNIISQITCGGLILTPNGIDI